MLKDAGDDFSIIGGLLEESWTALDTGDYPRAEQQLSQIIAISREALDLNSYWTGAWWMAFTAVQRGECGAAIEWLSHSLDIARDSQISNFMARSVELWAVCDPQQALAIGADELGRYRHAGNEVGVADIQLALGRIHMDGGQVDSARSSLTESMELWRRLGMSGNEWGGAGWACLELGHLEAMQGHPQSAAALYERSLHLHEEAHAMDGVAAACLGLGHACLEQDQFPQAARWFKRSLCHFREAGMRWGVALALAGLYGATLQLGHEHAAALYAGAASAILRPEELITLRPADRLPFEHMMASAQSRLSDTDFAAAWRTGRDLPLTEASALMLN